MLEPTVYSSPGPLRYYGVISPEEFADRMRVLAQTGDHNAHIDADALMCEILRSLGYGAGVDAFLAMKKHY